MNFLDARFAQLRSAGRKAFIPFLTAGDPDVDGTVRMARALAAAGADALELGFPYSDSLADGPVIQESYTRALARGLRLDDMFECARRITAAPEFAAGRTPLVAMASYSLVHRRGADVFLGQAQDAGLSGLIAPDLPLDEADDLAGRAAARDFKLIQLVTPSTPPERAAAVARQSTGFLYCVSISGITGTRDRLPDELLGQLASLRRQTDLPLCVGFGVSKPEHVRMLREAADGVIVGSALVRCLAAGRPLDEAVRAAVDLTRSLTAALNPA